MSNKDSGNLTRRGIVRKVGAASAAGLSVTATTATAGVGAASGRAVGGRDLDTNPVSLLDQDGLRSVPEGIEMKESIATGDQLLTRLSDYGLLESGTFSDLPTGELSDGSSEGVYRVRVANEINVGFRKQTDEGVLDVVFGETTFPIARLIPDDGPTVLFGSRDGRTIDSFESGSATDQRVRAETATSLACTDSTDCEPCDCEALFCIAGTKAIVCGSCYSGDCVTTTKCTCST